MSDSTPPVLDTPPEDRTAGADPSDITPFEGTVTDFLSQARDLAERWGPDAAMMAIPIPGSRLLGAARASRITGLSSGIAAKATNAASRSSPRASAMIGRGVSRGRRTLRKVNPRRSGTPSSSRPAPPPSLTQSIAQAGQETATSTLGRARAQSFLGATQRARQGSRFPQPLTGSSGIMSRLGAGESSRGMIQSAIRAGGVTAGLGVASRLGIAAAEGVLSDSRDNLKSSSDLSDSDRQAIDSAFAAAAQGNQQEAARILNESGVSADQLDTAIAAAEDDAAQRDSAALDADNQPPGRTINNQIDSLARDAAQTPGLPPTASATLAQQQDPQRAADLRNIRQVLSEQGRLPSTEVVTEVRTTHPSSPPEPITSSLNEVAGQLFDMDQGSLTDLQHKLFASGFYGQTSYDSIRFGARDPQTFDAFQSFLEQASFATQRSQTQGSGPTPWPNLLERWSMEAGGVSGAIEDSLGEPNYTVQLTDSDAVKQTLDTLASDVIGQGVSPKMQQRFVSMFHGQQRQAQIAQQRAQRQAQLSQLQAQSNRAMATRETAQQTRGQGRGGGQGQGQGQPQQDQDTTTVTEVTQPNVRARAQSFLESEFPVKSEAQGRVSAYDEFLSMIGAG